MKLIVAIVQDQDVSLLRDDLAEHKFHMTKLASSGGFLKTGNSTLLIGTPTERVEEALRIIAENCESRDTTASMVNLTSPQEPFMPIPMDVHIGGATVFVLDVEEHHRF